MLFHITEVYSNADGTVQFIEFVGDANGQNLLSVQTNLISSGSGSIPKQYSFPNDLPSTATAGRSVLVATQGFADLGIVTPDYIIPDGFLFIENGFIVLSDTDGVEYALLPTDGIHSLSGGTRPRPVIDDGAIVVNSPKNFAGATGSIEPDQSITGTDGPDNLVGAGGNDTITGAGGNDTLDGASGIDVLGGDAGNDVLTGGTGVDQQSGGDGDDIFIISSSAHHAVGEMIDGGADSDIIRFTSVTAGQALVLQNVTNVESVVIGTATGVTTGTTTLHVNASGVAQGISLIGNAGANTLTGTEFDDTLTGNAGNDTLVGNGGSDTLIGGAGADNQQGGAGDDLFLLGAVVDYAAGEVINGGADVDTLRYTGTLAATLTLTNLVTGLEQVQVADAAGNTTGMAAINVNAAAVGNALAISGNDGNNALTGTGLADTINGNGGNDVITGGAGDDTLNGGDGNDVFLIAAGAHHGAGETINGGLGTNVIRFTSAAAGTLSLSSGVTNIAEVEASDAAGGNVGTAALNINAAAVGSGLILTGNAGANTLTGTNAADTLTGNAGNDTLIGGAGEDTVTGGAGNDRIEMRVTAGDVDTIDAGTEVDTLALVGPVGGDGVVVVDLSSTIDQVTDIGTVDLESLVQKGFENVDGSGLASTLNATGSAGANLIIGSSGNDTLAGGGGLDNLQAGAGHDVILIGAGHFAAGEVINGGDGVDTLRYTGTAAATLTLTAQVTNLDNVQLSDDGITAGSGTAAININAAALANGIGLMGNNGANTLIGTAFSDGIGGNIGDDLIDGGAGNDDLIGGDGNDVLLIAAAAHHGAGESINGGTGSNVIRFTSATAGTLTLSGLITNVAEVEASNAAGGNAGLAALNIDATAVGSGLTLTGNAGMNVLTGTGFDDILVGGAGKDTQQGGAGDDRFVLASTAEFAAGELIDGGVADTDTLRYTGTVAATLMLTAGVTNIEEVQIANAAGLTTGTAAINVNAAAVGNALTISGNDGANVLTGTASDDTINGNGGNDVVLIAAGLHHGVGEVIDGGLGTNVIRFTSTTAGTLTLSGGVTNIAEVEASDAAGGNAGLAALNINAAAVVGSGLTLTGNAGANTLTGNAFDDVLLGNAGNDTLNGGGGADTLTGGAGVDNQQGGPGNDVFLYGAPADFSAGEAVDGGADTDALRFTSTTAGATLVLSGAVMVENVEIGTAAGLTTGTTALNVNASTVTNALAITGNNGANVLTGTAQADTLTGNGGNDTLNGGGGGDSLNGSDGNDILIWDPADTNVAGDAGSDTLQVNGTGVHVDLTAVADSVITDIEVINLTGSGNNLLTLAHTDVLAISSTTDTLRVDGNSGDAVSAGLGWTQIANVVIGAQTYAQYTKDGALLQVDTDINRSGINGVNLATLNGANGFKISGAAAGDESGGAIGSAGDVNGDGFDDLIVGAAYAGPNGTTSGASYVVFGTAGGFSSNISLSSLDGTTGFKLSGVVANDYSGASVSSAGDVNGDGFGDLIAGAPGADPTGIYSGASYVVFGKASGFTPNLNLSSLDGISGFRISGQDFLDFSGASVSAAGDVNGDGFGDLIMGAPTAGYGYAGASYVVFGKASGFASDINLSSLNGTTGFKLLTGEAYDYAGSSVSGAEDVNGDGFGDIIVGAFGADPNGTDSGASYVVFGKAGGFSPAISLSSLDGTTGFKLSGAGLRDYSGYSVSGAGDVNGDGFGDIIVGAFGADPNGTDSGASYVVFGKAGGFSSNINLSSLDGTTGFKLSGTVAGDSSGYSVGSAGDVNGDGFDDLIIGAPGADPNGGNSGASYVMFGKAGGFASTINLSSLNETSGFKVSGAAGLDESGTSVKSAGDVNGDGFDDLIVGAPYADPNGANSGASYVIFGADFRSEVDIAGTEGDDSLTGTSADEILIGGLGDDVLDGAGGADVLKGGAGNDVLVFDGADRLVDGGSGEDTLQFASSGESLDFSAIVDTRYIGIEVIDLTGTGDNSLTLETLDLLALSDSTNTLRVDGNAGDAVTSTGQGWVPGGTVDIDNILYQSYTDGAATLLLHPAIVDDSSIL